MSNEEQVKRKRRTKKTAQLARKEASAGATDGALRLAHALCTMRAETADTLMSCLQMRP